MRSSKVTTLIADPTREPLSDKDVNAAIEALEDSGAKITNVNWLAKDRACDIFFEVLDLPEALRILDHLFHSFPIDSITQIAEFRRKKLLVTDMDSTIITVECIDELAAEVGLKDKVAKITERAMNGELEFKSALRERVALLKGLPESTLAKVYRERVTLMPGARELVQTMKANGATCVLVSGGFTYFTGAVREAVGFHADSANELETENGTLTGKVMEPILDKEAKLETLERYRSKLDLQSYETLAVGDGANDLPMLLASGLGVAYHAKPSVRAQAHHKIDTCDLTALLYAQGYREEDFRM